ncbi:glycosyltransferase family 4 protein [Chryseobacterium culicis]|jgi:glycosyltransferase involved in cell wall biosynthesis|uniref:glycosyltransferase family 4 protein n=1 Tax=Chryseobacterium culicis TaxID=680127 RepID=UPI0025879162|nr:glycosyltransferase family 4 protein [Chryseobacterium culicis]
MKICYLTWGETPRSYGVFGSQVLGQFVANTDEIENGSFYFISGVPVIHSGHIREKGQYKEEIQKVKQKLGKINFISTPIFAVQSVAYMHRFLFKFLFHGAESFLAKHLKSISPDIIHCRGYGAAWLALKIKKKYNLNYKIIFDARGLFPEEYALKNKYTQPTANYLFLKKMEKQLLAECDVTIAVSDTMAQSYEEIGVKSIEKIYLSVDTENLNSTSGGPKDEVIYCYLGALTQATWHTIDDLLELYTKLREKTPGCKLKIITTSSHEAIKEVFVNIPENEIILTSTKNTNELKGELSDVNFGLLPYRKSTSSFEDAVGYSILGTKTVEFTAMGIPVIVNKECGGASVLTKKYDLGITYDPKTFEELSIENISRYINDGKEIERSNVAKDLFDYKKNAERYRKLYEKLTGV